MLPNFEIYFIIVCGLQWLVCKHSQSIFRTLQGNEEIFALGLLSLRHSPKSNFGVQM